MARIFLCEVDVIRFLLERGADPSAVNHAGFSPWMMVAEALTVSGEELRDSLELLKPQVSPEELLQVAEEPEALLQLVEEHVEWESDLADAEVLEDVEWAGDEMRA